jgi:hypothetical protein
MCDAEHLHPSQHDETRETPTVETPGEVSEDHDSVVRSCNEEGIPVRIRISLQDNIIDDLAEDVSTNDRASSGNRMAALLLMASTVAEDVLLESRGARNSHITITGNSSLSITLSMAATASSSESDYIGSAEAACLSPGTNQRFVRSHWAQTSARLLRATERYSTYDAMIMETAMNLRDGQLTLFPNARAQRDDSGSCIATGDKESRDSRSNADVESVIDKHAAIPNQKSEMMRPPPTMEGPEWVSSRDSCINDIGETSIKEENAVADTQRKTDQYGRAIHASSGSHGCHREDQNRRPPEVDASGRDQQDEPMTSIAARKIGESEVTSASQLESGRPPASRGTNREVRRTGDHSTVESFERLTYSTDTGSISIVLTGLDGTDVSTEAALGFEIMVYILAIAGAGSLSDSTRREEAAGRIRYEMGTVTRIAGPVMLPDDQGRAATTSAIARLVGYRLTLPSLRDNTMSHSDCEGDLVTKQDARRSAKLEKKTAKVVKVTDLCPADKVYCWPLPPQARVG